VGGSQASSGSGSPCVFLADVEKLVSPVSRLNIVVDDDDDDDDGGCANEIDTPFGNMRIDTHLAVVTETLSRQQSPRSTQGKHRRRDSQSVSDDSNVTYGRRHSQSSSPRSTSSWYVVQRKVQRRVILFVCFFLLLFNISLMRFDLMIIL
jgi:hypothetical protein